MNAQIDGVVGLLHMEDLHGVILVGHSYGGLVARYIAPLIADWHALAQTPVYILLGVVWLLPLRRFLIWMETGRWR